MNLEGSYSSPGQSTTQGGSGASNAVGRDRGYVPRDACQNVKLGKCYATIPKSSSPAPAPVAQVTVTPSVTVRDLAAFRPTPGRQQMEPNGWVVAGLDANFFAIVDRQLVSGTLLGRPARVRFTPVAYHWNYGDGAAAVRATKGGTWAALGLRDFDQTPTSHVYETEGDYVIRLTIDFRAEYQFGSAAFAPVSGTISLPANDLRVTVTGAKTVLVDHDCVVNPSGPGC